jgi:arylsulfatase A-like enzyme
VTGAARARLLALLAALAGAGCSSTPPPNVLLIVLDTARPDAFTAYGVSHGLATPIFDAMASEGVLFRNARSTSVWTLPAHASLFTGLFPSRHGAHHESHRLAADVVTMAELLAPSHDTAGFSENPHIGRAKGFAQGFATFEETWREESSAQRPDTLQLALAWLDARKGSARPFFVFVNLMDAHLPYAPPARWARDVLPGAIDPATADRLSRLTGREARLYMAGRLSLTPLELEGLRALYQAEVSHADARMGTLVEHLRDSGELDRTLVIAVSDHGENIGEHGLMEHQLCLCETLLRIPLVLRLPGVLPASQQRDAPVQLVDLLPSVLDAAGIPRRRWPELEGMSLLDGDLPSDRPVYAEYMRPLRQRERFAKLAPEFDFAPYDHRLRSIQVGSLKLVASDRGGVELYDLAADPGELHDLAAERPDAARDLALRLEGWARARSAHALLSEPTLDPETVEALRELGYGS